jgi:DNA-binding IclR family transcriptional regulator
LLEELAIIRRQGWSESKAEITPHVYAVAVGIAEASGIVAALPSSPHRSVSRDPRRSN